jgi:hypothetical protein
MVNSAASAATQRSLADVLLKPALDNVDLLDWRAFDRAIQVGYEHACELIGEIPDIPRLTAVGGGSPRVSSLTRELERRIAAAT